jgi:hypothetical protein
MRIDVGTGLPPRRDQIMELLNYCVSFCPLLLAGSTRRHELLPLRFQRIDSLK